MWAAIVLGIVCGLIAIESVLTLSKKGESDTAMACCIAFLFLICMYIILLFSASNKHSESKYEKVTETFYRLKE